MIVNEVTEMTSALPLTDNIYFAPLLPWQNELWSQLTKRVLMPQQSLPHALLAAGMQGMGKRGAPIMNAIKRVDQFRERDEAFSALVDEFEKSFE